jgi:uncharacterized protein YndB with AHSA1/START domain
MERSVVHATFTLKRRYKAAPARVFEAFADPAAKAKWFGAPGDGTQKASLDFRIGGREHSSGRIPNGPHYTFDALYEDIVPDARIIYTYQMTIDGRRISVSVATIELKPAGAGTELSLTEMGAFLDGLDNAAQREAGTRDLLDKLGAALES